jgi:hypothetical protein
LLGDFELLGSIQRGAGALFAVAQGGVKEQYLVAVGDRTRIGFLVMDDKLLYIDDDQLFLAIAGSGHHLGVTGAGDGYAICIGATAVVVAHVQSLLR